MKHTSLIILLFSLSSCFLTKKEYQALEQDLAQVKSNLKDDDQDGVANYMDLEPRTSVFEKVDSKGRTIYIEKVVDIDQDGILDVEDFCPTIKGVSAANGCPDLDGDGFYDFLDRCPKAAGMDSLDGCPIIKGKNVLYEKKIPTNYGIRFLDKTTKYRPKTKTILDTLILQATDLLAKNPSYLLEIRSFTDSIGDSLTNITLCEKRAEQVKKLLLKKGVEENRLFIRAFGSQKPKHSNETKEGREANNRIEFFILKED